jgi:acyl-coenzyme A synthetase/AMP-(fatty) acid ligase
LVPLQRLFFSVRFTLQTLPADDFPLVNEAADFGPVFAVPQKTLRMLVNQVHFAMAVHDIRYYLNGILFVAEGRMLTLVATDGHRLALAQAHRVTHAMLVPVQYERLLARPEFDHHDLSSLRYKFSTSAPFAPALKAEVLRRWPGALVEFYGMTEGGVFPSYPHSYSST